MRMPHATFAESPLKMAPMESKPIGHKTCVNTPPSHNQQNIINYSAACARCELGLFM